MKQFAKIKQSLAILPLLLAGCTINEITEVNTSSSEYVGFIANTTASTRASITTLTTMQNDPDGFRVYATGNNQSGWYTDENGRSIDGANNYIYYAGKWRFNDIVKWPSASSGYPMFFYAFYPSSPDGLGTIQYDQAAITATYTVQPAGNQIDLLAATASTLSHPASGLLPLTFQHILSKVNIGTIAGEGVNLYIQTVQVDSVQSVRSYDFTHKAWTGQASAKTSFNYFGKPDGLTVLTPFAPGAGDGSTITPVYSGNHNNHLMLMPQTSPTWSPQSGSLAGGHIVVIYRMSTGNATSGAGNLREVGFESASKHPNYAGGYTGPLFVKAGFPLPVEKQPDFTWEMGRGYTYNIGLGTANSCNGYILDEYYYDDKGDRTSLKLVEVLNEGKTTGSKLQDGVIHVTLDVSSWTDEPSSEIPLGEAKQAHYDVMLDYTEQLPAAHSFDVVYLNANGTENPNANWTLSVPDTGNDWVRLSLSDTPNSFNVSDGFTVSGKGRQRVYINVRENDTKKHRYVPVFFNNKEAGSILQECNLSESEVAPALWEGIVTYVGAFWRADQKGERIINSHYGRNANNVGKWRVAVSWMDGRWNPGDIVLAAGPSPNLLVDAEDNPVQGNAQAIYGELEQDGYITFRIGLKSTYSPTEDYPARYAIVTIAYNDYNKVEKIFLRQGEGADYVMRPSDKMLDKMSRPAAKRFVPYNLTDPLFGEALTYDLSNDINLQGDMNRFTAYPTQGGYTFQWNYSTKAFTPLNADLSGFSREMKGVEFWDSNSHETCPDGYRRPNDGPQKSAHTPSSNDNITGSEMRQSLLYKPANQSEMIENKADYVAFGYYADGFFDRKKLQKAKDMEAPTGIDYDLAVELNTPYAAYAGQLYFNPITNASLFFPAAGNRMCFDDKFFVNQNRSVYGNYLTSSSVNDTHCWIMTFILYKTYHDGIIRNSVSQSSTFDRTNSASVRCIKDE